MVRGVAIHFWITCIVVFSFVYRSNGYAYDVIATNANFTTGMMSATSNVGDSMEHLTLHISSAVLDNAFSCNVVSEGCFGVVYKIPYEGVFYAAKHQCFDEEYKLEQFRQECLLHSKLCHPNIVQMLGVCYHGNNLDQPIKVMELLKLNLSSFIYQYKVPMYVKLTLIQDISRGLDYLHTRNPPIIHSYLTLNVILLTANLIAKIGGFTFAVEMIKTNKPLPVHSTCDVLRENSLKYGPPFDIYSFGCLIGEIITNESYEKINFIFNNVIDQVFLVHPIDIGQREYFINLIKNTSMRQLIIDCLNINPNLRPPASLISSIIESVMKGKLYCVLFLFSNTVLVIKTGSKLQDQEEARAYYIFKSMQFLFFVL